MIRRIGSVVVGWSIMSGIGFGQGAVSTPEEFSKLVAADEVSGVPSYSFEDASKSWPRISRQPVIVTGVFDSAQPPSLPQIKRMLGESYQRVRAYTKGAVDKNSVEVGVDDIFDPLIDGRPSAYNVVDHPADFLGKAGFHRPRFFGDNWLHGNPALKQLSGCGAKFYTGDQDSQFLRMHAGHWLNLSLTATGANNYTNLHDDSDGLGAWMYLLHGEKYWEAISPDSAQHLWVKEEYRFVTGINLKKSPAKVDRKYTATAQAGDLIFLPPGWVHHVYTSKPSIGVGGSLVTGFHLEESVANVLRDRERGVNCLDLLAILKAVPPARHTQFSAHLETAIRQLEE